MNCPVCGASNLSEASVCTSCSTKLEVPASPTSAVTGQPVATINKRKSTHYGRLVVIAALVVAAVIALKPLAVRYSNQLTLDSANPTMVALAQQAGMSQQGELLFLRADPKLDTDIQLATDCSVNQTANNNNGFIEQGCYDPKSNRIYLRKMPTDFSSLESVTAAYEMLHIVYINLDKGSTAAPLNAAIESNYRAINDNNLNTQVANFAKTEPGERDLELFSLLGTGYSHLSTALSNYYAPYFTNLAVNVTRNNQVQAIFLNDQSQLASLKALIANYNSAADTAYANSVAAANAGNAVGNSTNYHIYTSDISSENATINNYNQLIGQYNFLVTEYNGTQPVAQIQTSRKQGSSQD